MKHPPRRRSVRFSPVGRLAQITASLAALALAGCITTSGPEIGQRQTTQGPPPASASSAKNSFVPQPLTVGPANPARSFPRSIEQSRANAAVIALYHQAGEAQAGGHFGKAGSAYERAMRLAPRNAFVWSALAGLHLQMQQPQQADSEARKSNSLAGGNPYLLHANWATIAAAAKATGNSAAAQQARALADKYARLTTSR